MDHQADMILPDRFGNCALEERGNQQVRLIQIDCLNGDIVVDIEFNRDLVPQCLQLDEQPLRETVEGMGEEQDAH